MRTNENMTTNEATKICVMRGYYDEEGEYREEIMENISLSKLPEKAIPRVDLTYDVTILYSKEDVLVISRRVEDIYEYKRIEGKPRFFHSLLHCSNLNWYDGYMCIVVNLKVLKRRHMKNHK